MRIIRNFIKWVKSFLRIDPYVEVKNIVWDVVAKGASNWNNHAGLEPEKHDGYTRLLCQRVGDDDYQTAAIRTHDAYSDGKFECEARFCSGKSTWPAIWVKHYGIENSDYFEIDLSEYYETRDDTDTTYHMPESVADSTKRFPSIKTKINKDGWNKFVCTWDEKALTVSINGKVIWEFRNNGNAEQYPLTEEQREFNVILSMQYANKWLETPDLDELPLWMDVRNIRLYRRKKDKK